MRTVLLAFYLNSEKNPKALIIEQGLNFICSYKVKKGENTVVDIE